MKPVSSQLFSLFSIQYSQRWCCWAENDQITWGSKSPSSLLVCLGTDLRAFASFCYEKTSMEFWVSVARKYLTSTKPLLSSGGGEGKEVDEKWKTSIKTSGYCHKHFYQSHNCTQAPNTSLSPELSVLIRKFTCQLGSKSTRVCVTVLCQVWTFLCDKWEVGRTRTKIVKIYN